MWFNEKEDNNQWTSSRQRAPSSRSNYIVEDHNAIFARVESSISQGFASMQKSLVDLQMQLHLKCVQLKNKQTISFKEFEPDDIIFEENMRKITRSLQTFQSQADNLSHIRLTLSRVTSLFANDGPLSQLIVPQERLEQHNIALENDVFSTLSLREPASEISLAPNSSYSELMAQKHATLQEKDAEDHVRWLSPQTQTTVPTAEHAELSESKASQIAYLEEIMLREKLDSDSIIDESKLMPVDSLGWARNVNTNWRLDRYSVGISQPFPPFTKRHPMCTCFIFYLPAGATDENLKQLFMPYGVVLNAYVAMDKVTGHTRGFGFVDYSNEKEAEKAVANLDHFPWGGKFLSVSIKV